MAVVVAFTLAGFWWFDGYHLVVVRYYQGIASDRPYAYWVWADLALAVACAGPVAAVILRRAVVRADPAALLRRPLTVFGPEPGVLLPVAGLLAILAADLSGLSKAEVERIWLPFAVWLPAGARAAPVTGKVRLAPLAGGDRAADQSPSAHDLVTNLSPAAAGQHAPSDEQEYGETQICLLVATGSGQFLLIHDAPFRG